MLIKLTMVSAQRFESDIGPPVAGGGVGTLTYLGAQVEQAFSFILHMQPFLQ
jgi:hypothetical protein